MIWKHAGMPKIVGAFLPLEDEKKRVNSTADAMTLKSACCGAAIFPESEVEQTSSPTSRKRHL
jgi:hypothetical protein